jgi:hypothetical protein
VTSFPSSSASLIAWRLIRIEPSSWSAGIVLYLWNTQESEVTTLNTTDAEELSSKSPADKLAGLL